MPPASPSSLLTPHLTNGLTLRYVDQVVRQLTA